ncbi:MAG: FAD-dependent oxidoreductase [Acholeplasmatales bacterium]|nr:FAD-dependent oxidoreductase [Acholeplasmatales bacterium]
MDRISDFEEIYTPLKITEVKPLLDRCYNCSEPFCSKKLIVDNNLVGCPLEININKIISLMKYDLYDEAYKELTKNNPFPEITSRVCKGYCEYSCINNKDNNPTSIREIIRTLSDYALDHNLVDTSIKENKNKKVTIIGSGASGLSCAYYLAKEGYNVTVYEKDECPGGTLMYGISNMRLSKDILNRRIDLLKKMGVNFICNTEVTRVISPMEVLDNTDALVIASGVIKRRFVCPGMGLKNVMYATDYLKKVTKNILTSGKSDILENKKVLIIGSGDTSSDVISYALREKASMIAVIDYKNMPPLKRTNSWPQPSDALIIDEAILEARAKSKMDPRSFNMTIKEIIGNNSVDGVKLTQVKWENGNPIISDREQTFPVDEVIISVGNIGFEEDLINYFDIDVVNKMVDEFKHNNGKVFICGEALLNNGVTALAIKDGLKCAKEVSEYLEA